MKNKFEIKRYDSGKKKKRIVCFIHEVITNRVIL